MSELTVLVKILSTKMKFEMITNIFSSKIFRCTIKAGCGGTLKSGGRFEMELMRLHLATAPLFSVHPSTFPVDRVSEVLQNGLPLCVCVCVCVCACECVCVCV